MNRLSRQGIHTLVVWITGVTSHPVPFDLMDLNRGIEKLPQIGVGERSSFAPPPAFPPVGYPFRDPLFKIFRVCVKVYAARSIKRLQGLNRRGNLHAVVRRLWLGAAQYLFVTFKA